MKDNASLNTNFKIEIRLCGEHMNRIEDKVKWREETKQES